MPQTLRKSVQSFVDELTDRFNTHGPFTVENDLTRMFALHKQFQNDLNRTEQRRVDLFNAMKLFHIPVIPYPGLIRLQTELNGLQLLADLHEDFKRNERLWSNVLWSELNINGLMSSADGFVKRFRQLPQPVKNTAVGHAVEKSLTGISFDREPQTTLFHSDFRSSLPIMADLKSEALRERHWQQILQETNLDANLTSNVLTLETIFQMNLHQYNDVIQGNFPRPCQRIHTRSTLAILQTARKELQIDTHLKDVQQQWDTMRFHIQKHYRQTLPTGASQERGFILADVDDILQALEDATLLLHST